MLSDSFHTFVNVIKDFVSSSLVLFNKLTQLAKLEARLARRSIVNLILLSYVLRMLLTTTWVGVLIALFLLFIYFKLSWLIAFFIIAILNVFLLTAVVLLMWKMKNNLTFPATRRQLSGLKPE